MNFCVQNMKCNACAARIHEKLSSVAGLSDIKIDLEEGSIQFNYSHQDDLKAAKFLLKNLGYPLSEDENSIALISKSYVNCMIGKIKKSK